MHKVKQAIIMAAGMGTRLQPLTHKTPKPLIRVNGIRIIDTIIEGLKFHGIQNIYIVVGYKKEQFEPLALEYPEVKLIENPAYKTYNNISSLYVAREHLEDTIIIDGDQVIVNPNILSPEFERSGYNAAWTDTATTEWIMTVENGLVTNCNRNGGNNGWQLYGISRWSTADGQKLRKHLEIEFEQNHQQNIYWDDVVMFLHLNEYQLGIWEMKKDDIFEIDSLEELATHDSEYRKYLSGENRYETQDIQERRIQKN